MIDELFRGLMFRWVQVWTKEELFKAYLRLSLERVHKYIKHQIKTVSKTQAKITRQAISVWK